MSRRGRLRGVVAGHLARRFHAHAVFAAQHRRKIDAETLVEIAELLFGRPVIAGVAQVLKNAAEILRRHRPRAQQSQFPALDLDDGGFDAVLGRAAVDDERDAPVEFAAHVLRRGRADAPEAVRAGCGQRVTEMLPPTPRGRPDARSSARPRYRARRSQYPARSTGAAAPA